MAQVVMYPIIILLSSAAIMSPLSILEGRLKFKQLKLILTIFSLTSCLILLLTLYQQVSSEGHVEAFLYGFSLPFGVQIYVDEFSVYMAVIFCLLGLLVAIFSYRYMEVDTGLDKYYGLLLTLITGMIGVTFAGDLFNLYVFWELMCISSYSLVSFRKYRWEAVEAGFKYLVMSTIGSLIALYGISIIYGCFKTVNMREIAMQLTLVRAELNSSAILSLYFAAGLIICGFAVTAALVPFHTWLPDAHPAAPASISAMLSGVVIKTGIYAMARVLFTVFNIVPLNAIVKLEMHPVPIVNYGFILLVLGVLTITIANVMVLRQRDLKRFLAYSSIVNMGYIASGLGIAAHLLYHYSDQAYESAIIAASGAILHILNHAIGKGLLFLSSGCIVHEAKTRDLTKIEGIGRKMPWTGISSTIGLFHLAGVPPMAGFWSKLLIIWGGLSHPQDIFLLISTAIIIVNSTYAAGYYLWLVQRLMFSKTGSAAEKAHDAPLSMLAPIVVLASSCILLTILLPWLIPVVESSVLALIGS